MYIPNSNTNVHKFHQPIFNLSQLKKCFPETDGNHKIEWSQIANTSEPKQSSLCFSYKNKAINLPTNKNFYLMQQNRILINYKKLFQFNNSFQKNKDFFKKYFDLTYSQLKSSTVKSPNRRLVRNKSLNPTAKSLTNLSKPTENHELLLVLNKRIDKPTKSTSIYRFKILKEALSEKNNILFNALELFNYNLSDALMVIKSSDLFCENKNIRNFDEIENEYIFKFNNQSNNPIFQEKIDFRMSMIQFTLHLRKILLKIEKVCLFIRFYKDEMYH